MEILFENCYTITKDRYMEWVCNPIKKNHFVILWLVLMVLTIFMFIYSIFKKDIVSSACYVLFFAFCIYRGFFRTKILSSKYFKVLAINQGSMEWERKIQFTECITVIDGNTTTQYQWSQVVELIDNKEYLILVFRNGVGIRLTKNGFTKGTYDTFLQFFKNKNNMLLQKQ